MSRLWFNVLIVALFALLPLGQNRPSISRARAIEVFDRQSKFIEFFLKRFWVIYFLCVPASSISLIIWSEYYAFLSDAAEVMLFLVFAFSSIAMCLAAAIPGYVVVKHWKDKSGTSDEGRG